MRCETPENQRVLAANLTTKRQKGVVQLRTHPQVNLFKPQSFENSNSPCSSGGKKRRARAFAVRAEMREISACVNFDASLLHLNYLNRKILLLLVTYVMSTI